jgi:3-hydroxymyristoyl/3-hydroxydecanoyl-(acyl carrier protein) dehydratase
MRYLHVDRITTLEPDRARGVKCVSLSDDALADHFAGWPIYPGALVLEAMAQLGGAMLDDGCARAGEAALAMLVGVDRARFRRQVVPGDQLALEADVEQRALDGVRVRVAAMVGGERVAEAVLSYAIARDVPAAFVEERAKVRALMQHGRWYR